MKKNISIILLSRIYIIFVIISLSFLLFISCADNEQSTDNNAHTLSVDLDTIKYRPSVADLFERIEIIPLETRRESIIESSGSLKHQVFNNKYYILSAKQKKLFVFDRKGNFIKAIDKTGNGPGEYLMIYDFEISRFDGKLHLMTPYGKVLIYNTDGDEFLGSFNLPDSIRAVHFFKILDEDTYVFGSNSEKSDIYFYSKSKNEIVSSLSTMPNFLNSTPFKFARTPFYYYNDSLRYFMGYDGTVFNINHNNYSLEKRYFLDFGKRNFILSDLPLNESVVYYFEYSKSIASKIVTGFSTFLETDKYLISRYSYRNNLNFLFYNKHNNKIMSVYKVKEDAQLRLSFVEKDTLYSFVAVEFAHLVVNDKIVDEVNYSKYKNLNSESNMFIIKYVLK